MQNLKAKKASNPGTRRGDASTKGESAEEESNENDTEEEVVDDFFDFDEMEDMIIVDEVDEVIGSCDEEERKSISKSGGKCNEGKLSKRKNSVLSESLSKKKENENSSRDCEDESNVVENNPSSADSNEKSSKQQNSVSTESLLREDENSHRNCEDKTTIAENDLPSADSDEKLLEQNNSISTESLSKENENSSRNCEDESNVAENDPSSADSNEKSSEQENSVLTESSLREDENSHRNCEDKTTVAENDLPSADSDEKLLEQNNSISTESLSKENENSSRNCEDKITFAENDLPSADSNEKSSEQKNSVSTESLLREDENSYRNCEDKTTVAENDLPSAETTVAENDLPSAETTIAENDLPSADSNEKSSEQKNSISTESLSKENENSSRNREDESNVAENNPSSADSNEKLLEQENTLSTESSPKRKNSTSTKSSSRKSENSADSKDKLVKQKSSVSSKSSTKRKNSVSNKSSSKKNKNSCGNKSTVTEKCHYSADSNEKSMEQKSSVSSQLPAKKNEDSIGNSEEESTTVESLPSKGSSNTKDREVSCTKTAPQKPPYILLVPRICIPRISIESYKLSKAAPKDDSSKSLSTSVNTANNTSSQEKEKKVAEPAKKDCRENKKEKKSSHEKEKKIEDLKKKSCKDKNEHIPEEERKKVENKGNTSAPEKKELITKFKIPRIKKREQRSEDNCDEGSLKKKKLKIVNSTEINKDRDLKATTNEERSHQNSRKNVDLWDSIIKTEPVHDSPTSSFRKRKHDFETPKNENRQIEWVNTEEWTDEDTITNGNRFDGKKRRSNDALERRNEHLIKTRPFVERDSKSENSFENRTYGSSFVEKIQLKDTTTIRDYAKTLPLSEDDKKKRETDTKDSSHLGSFDERQKKKDSKDEAVIAIRNTYDGHPGNRNLQRADLKFTEKRRDETWNSDKDSSKVIPKLCDEMTSRERREDSFRVSAQERSSIAAKNLKEDDFFTNKRNYEEKNRRIDDAKVIPLIRRDIHTTSSFVEKDFKSAKIAENDPKRFKIANKYEERYNLKHVETSNDGTEKKGDDARNLHSEIPVVLDRRWSAQQRFTSSNDRRSEISPTAKQPTNAAILIDERPYAKGYSDRDGKNENTIDDMTAWNSSRKWENIRVEKIVNYESRNVITIDTNKGGERRSDSLAENPKMKEFYKTISQTEEGSKLIDQKEVGTNDSKTEATSMQRVDRKVDDRNSRNENRDPSNRERRTRTRWEPDIRYDRYESSSAQVKDSFGRDVTLKNSSMSSARSRTDYEHGSGRSFDDRKSNDACEADKEPREDSRNENFQKALPPLEKDQKNDEKKENENARGQNVLPSFAQLEIEKKLAESRNTGSSDAQNEKSSERVGTTKDCRAIGVIGSVAVSSSLGEVETRVATLRNEDESKKENLIDLTIDLNDPAIREALPLLEEYRKAVKYDPTDFTAWTHLLRHVDQGNHIPVACEVYDDFLSKYPYCYGYWRKYADYLRKHEKKDECEKVFERGVRAIPLSVDLWIHYLDFTREFYPKDEDRLRELFERSLNVCGLEFRSDNLWETYIRWETDKGNLLNVTKILDRWLQVPSRAYTTVMDKFREHVEKHSPQEILSMDEFLRLRLRMEEKTRPLGADLTLSEKKAMKEKIIDIRKEYHKKTQKATQDRWSYEENIKRPYFHVKPLEDYQLDNWREYLDFEIKEGDPERITVLFERCLIACASYEEFWIRFTDYLLTLPDKDVKEVREVFTRACTIHHPRKLKIHLKWAQFEQRHGDPLRAPPILERMEKMCPNVLMLMIRRINLLRLRGEFELVTSLYEQYIDGVNDTNKEVASILATKYTSSCNQIFNHIQKAFGVLKEIIKNEKTKSLGLSLSPSLEHRWFFVCSFGHCHAVYRSIQAKYWSERNSYEAGEFVITDEHPGGPRISVIAAKEMKRVEVEDNSCDINRCLMMTKNQNYDDLIPACSTVSIESSSVTNPVMISDPLSAPSEHVPQSGQNSNSVNTIPQLGQPSSSRPGRRSETDRLIERTKRQILQLLSSLQIPKSVQQPDNVGKIPVLKNNGLSERCANPSSNVAPNQSMPQAIPSASSQAIPPATPQVMSQRIPQIVPPPETPQVLPQRIPQMVPPPEIPEALSQSLPQMVPPPEMPQVLPQGTPQTVQQPVMPQALPQRTPQTVPPSVMPQRIPQIVPSPAMPQTISQPIPQRIPQATLHGIPQAVPYGTPQASVPAMLQIMVQGMPQSRPPAMLQAGMPPQVLPPTALRGMPFSMSQARFPLASYNSGGNEFMEVIRPHNFDPNTLNRNVDIGAQSMTGTEPLVRPPVQEYRNPNQNTELQSNWDSDYGVVADWRPLHLMFTSLPIEVNDSSRTWCRKVCFFERIVPEIRITLNRIENVSAILDIAVENSLIPGEFYDKHKASLVSFQIPSTHETPRKTLVSWRKDQICFHKEHIKAQLLYSDRHQNDPDMIYFNRFFVVDELRGVDHVILGGDAICDRRPRYSDALNAIMLDDRHNYQHIIRVHRWHLVTDMILIPEEGPPSIGPSVTSRFFDVHYGENGRECYSTKRVEIAEGRPARDNLARLHTNDVDLQKLRQEIADRARRIAHLKL